MDISTTLGLAARVVQIASFAIRFQTALHDAVDIDLSITEARSIVSEIVLVEDDIPTSLQPVVEEYKAFLDDLSSTLKEYEESRARWGGKLHSISHPFWRRRMYSKLRPVIAMRRQILLAITEFQDITHNEMIQSIKNSSVFETLDPYSKAAADALLMQCKFSTDRYFLAVGMLINRVNGQIDSVDINGGDSRGSREQAIRVEVTSQVLMLLEYREMGHRGSNIGNAFDLSLKWVYEAPHNNKWVDLVDWLTCGSGLYLITGNEASGKSTLMKHILSNAKTASNLEKWAGTDTLAVASFFLWRNGTRLEKSEEGLLRSLLHTVLDQYPQLVPSVLPREFAEMYTTASFRDDHQTSGIGAWNVQDLRQSFKRLLNQTQMPLKLFFLIDGIDEYEPESGERAHGRIIEFFVNDVAASPNAKAIISSRPLEELKDLALEPKLILHDLNHDDIKTYVHQVLHDDEGFRKAQEQQRHKSEAIIDYIIKNSNGVFLWAVLSVNAVITRVANNKGLDEILDDLEKQLDSELKQLYERMWFSIADPVKRRASQALQIMLLGTDTTHSKSQGVVEFMRLIDLTLALGDPKETIQLKTSYRMSAEDQMKTRCDHLAREMATTWPGFIITQGPSSSTGGWNPAERVNYCHRSVPEFIREFQDQISPHGNADEYRFCPHIAQIKSAVHQLKIMPIFLSGNPLKPLWALVFRGLLAANLADKGDSATWSSYMDLLKELDRVMTDHHTSLQKGSDGRFLETRLQDPQGVVGIDDHGREARRVANMHWSNFHFDPAYSHPRHWNDSFLSLAIQFGLQKYVETELGDDKKILKSKKGRPLLDYALYPSPIGLSELITPEIVKLLLDHGANPNKRFNKRTCWEGALLWQYETFVQSKGKAIGAATGGRTEDLRRVADARVEICRLLVERGADVNVNIWTLGKLRISARKAVDDALREWCNNKQSFEELINLFPETDSNRE